MKLFMSLTLFLSLILSTTARSVGTRIEQSEDKKNGYLSLDSCVYDFGLILPDSIAERTLRFINAGDGPLQIISIFSDCGCTSTEFTRDIVFPGMEGDIRIRFNPKGRPVGPFRKVLRIRSTASNPRVTLIVKGIVIGESALSHSSSGF